MRKRRRTHIPDWDYTGRLCEARVVRNHRAIGIPYRVEVKRLKHGDGKWHTQNFYDSRAEAAAEARRLNKLRSYSV